MMQHPEGEYFEDECVETEILECDTLLAAGDDTPFEVLVERLRDEQWHIRAAAATALGGRSVTGAVEPLLQALNDEEWLVRTRAATALGKLGDPRAVQPLVELTLLEPMPPEPDELRRAAIEALGLLGDSRAVEPLLHTVRDPQWLVCFASAAALGRLGAVEALLDLLGDDSLLVRAAAARGLAESRDPRAVGPLCAALLDEAPVRLQAARSLGLLEDPAAVVPLCQVGRDDNFWVRQAVVQALGRLRDPRALSAVVDVLKDSNYRVREAAAIALAQIGHRDALPPLRARLLPVPFGEYHPVVRTAVQGAVDYLKRPRRPPFPVPAQPPSVDAAILPRVAEGAPETPHHLPRAVE